MREGQRDKGGLKKGVEASTLTGQTYKRKAKCSNIITGTAQKKGMRNDTREVERKK